MRRFSCRQILFVLLLTAGIGLCLWPGLARILAQQESVQLAADVQKTTAALPDERIEQMIQQAKDYNSSLTGSIGTKDIQPYKDQLNAYGEGIMGILSIPSIKETLPIYHGTSDEVLSVGVGHLENTALPVGIKGIRPVLTGHRGMASRLLFTRLDEMKPGDAFFIENPKETMAYEVSEIQIISPEELDALQPVENEDLVTLMTCTPYGINSHRLLVTGKRVPYTPAMEQAQPLKAPSVREQAINYGPWILAAVGLSFVFIPVFKRRKKRDQQSDQS